MHDLPKEVCIINKKTGDWCINIKTPLDTPKAKEN